MNENQKYPEDSRSREAVGGTLCAGRDLRGFYFKGGAMPRHKEICAIQGKATKWDHLKIIYGGQYQPPESCDRDRMLSDQFKDFLTGKDSFHQKMKREARVRNEELDKTLKDLVQIFGYGTAGQKEAAKGTLSVLARISREMVTTD